MEQNTYISHLSRFQELLGDILIDKSKSLCPLVEVLNTKSLYLYFGAEWCGPCTFY